MLYEVITAALTVAVIVFGAAFSPASAQSAPKPLVPMKTVAAPQNAVAPAAAAGRRVNIPGTRNNFV